MCFSDVIISSIIFIFVETVAVNPIQILLTYDNVKCAQLTCQNTLNLKINKIVKNQHFCQNQKHITGTPFILCNQMCFRKPLQLTVHSVAYSSVVPSPSRPVF